MAPIRLPSTPPQVLEGSTRGTSLGPRSAAPTAYAAMSATATDTVTITRKFRPHVSAEFTNTM